MIESELSKPTGPVSNLYVQPLTGKLTAQYVTCGKPDCRCRNGKLHGPYHYRVWREGEHIRKEYVKSADVEWVRASCEANQEMLRSIGEHRTERRRLTRQIQLSTRETEKMMKLPL